MKKRQKPKSVESMLRASAKKGRLNPFAAGLPDGWGPGVDRVTAVIKGEPSYVTEVRIDSLVVERPHVLEAARRSVLENPSMMAPIRALREVGVWPVYRNAEGRLVTFDDYNSYAGCEVDGVETVKIQVLGETAPLSDSEAENCPEGWIAPIALVRR